MRTWVHGTTNPFSLTPSAALSVAAHAALIGGAVYGTGRRADALRQQIAERVYYLPPPDRTPSQEPLAERVRYHTVGAGAPVKGPTSAHGQPVGRAGDAPVTSRGGPDAESQAAQVAVDASRDSVYSVLNVDQAATRVEGSGAPIYPPALVEQKVEGSVLAQYVVDSTGYTDPATVEILSSTHPEFVKSVRDALLVMRFAPGVVDGRRVRQLVQQSFTFRITPPAPAAAADHTRATPPS